MTPFAPNVANGKSKAPERDHTLDTFRRYADVFGPGFSRAVKRAERRGLVAPARAPAAEVAIERPAPKVIERTKTRTVVRDGGWRAKADEARAAKRAAEDQLASATTDNKRLQDRLAAFEQRVARLRAELDEARGVTLEAAERASVSELVQSAEARVEAAELRAARAEREAAEHGAAVTGELRRLTPAELNEMKSNGPAGPAVLAAALKKLALARSSGARAPLNEALVEVARAALHWRARL